MSRFPWTGNRNLLDPDELHVGFRLPSLAFQTELDDLFYVSQQLIEGATLSVAALQLGHLAHIEAVLVLLDDNVEFALLPLSLHNDSSPTFGPYIPHFLHSSGGSTLMGSGNS